MKSIVKSQRIRIFSLVIALLSLVVASDFVYSQPSADSNCKSNLENILKVREFKEKYETVQHIYKYMGRRFSRNDTFLNNSFKLIRGVPYFEEQKDTTSGAKYGELSLAELMSKEEVDRYLEQLNYTPEEAYRDYSNFIRKIKLEKELYLKCIEAELAKGDVSEYAKSKMSYFHIPPRSSLIPPEITKLDFLKIFKEFVLNKNEEILPDGASVRTYLRRLRPDADLICETNLENIFKVHTLKIRYETILFICDSAQPYHGFMWMLRKEDWNKYSGLIGGFSIFEERRDSISGVDTENEKRPSKEEMNGCVEQVKLNYTPGKAMQEYKDFIRTIKSEKEIYLKCIDAELAKGNLSEYASIAPSLYNFLPPGCSLIPYPMAALRTQLDFLKVFKEFVLNDDEEVLPEGVRVHEYLKLTVKSRN
jgi:hypothetical protein